MKRYMVVYKDDEVLGVRAVWGQTDAPHGKRNPNPFGDRQIHADDPIREEYPGVNKIMFVNARDELDAYTWATQGEDQ